MLGYVPKIKPFSVRNGEESLQLWEQGQAGKGKGEEAFWAERAWVRGMEEGGVGVGAGGNGNGNVVQVPPAGNVAVPVTGPANLVPGPVNLGKGKGRADPELEPEPGVVPVPEMEEDGEEGAGIECQCCFGEYPFVSRSLSHRLSHANIRLRRTKWSNAPKPISSAQRASPPTPPPNSANTHPS